SIAPIGLGRLFPGFHNTDFPSNIQPEQICLTWNGDPATSMTIQWRSSPEVDDGILQFRESTKTDMSVTEVIPNKLQLTDSGTRNDPVNNRFSVVLNNLTPETSYDYRVACDGAFSEWRAFTTAPFPAQSFSFVYMGDPQVGLDTWGKLVHEADTRHPDTAFYVVAGDNVNRGNNRDEWDALFHAAGGVFDRKPYVPALGNHDCPGGDRPRLFLELLTLPENGPRELEQERAYSLKYGNALFLVLDSNSDLEAQARWMEEQMNTSLATWKFAVYHHPAYSSAPLRDNVELREKWGVLFDKYHVDMALQGHDHGYLRTRPMRGGKEVASPAEGTIYVVSVSGTKLYDVEQHEYAEKSLERVSTYQIIDIETGNQDKLTYRAYDMDGNVRDEFVIVNQKRLQAGRIK
ncbi:MAG TPA: metallophosphoesterase family protein, partial [Candidatus Hydrogenedentes bacterium]|nr:metallophosphoesterase family protein [Candidatus Hydrogenedentota bacterium]